MRPHGNRRKSFARKADGVFGRHRKLIRRIAAATKEVYVQEELADVRKRDRIIEKARDGRGHEAIREIPD